MKSSSVNSLQFREGDKRGRFEQTRVLVADRDMRIAEIIRRVLFDFGFRRVSMVDSGEKALAALNEHSYELLITEWNMTPTDGITLVKAIRRAKDAKRLRRDIPVIMLTGKAEKPDVELARDAGITEFLVKPFSAKTLSDRIIKVIDFPRIFVEAEVYAGPCRRRRRPDAPQGKERRVSQELRQREERAWKGETQDEGDNDLLGLVAFLPPNKEIKEQIGEDITAQQILTEEVVAEGQETLLAAASEYVAWVRDDIVRLEESYLELSNRPTDPTAHHLLLSSAYAIKTQAGTFGYDLGSEVGKLLVDYLTNNMVMDANRLKVIRKHIDAISVIFTQKIKETGQDIAADLIKSLRQLITKLG